ncbi:hypothetical protein CH373_00950 [Leptospira perolatii]|uniref:tRNA(Ile)-lysidine/2-thiocytidine synthase N-terminal domain-containing protein n=1 Tax=Leptospira perolatii TaxID=2023191 RepID=A0A2M9ZRQ8_9LEPT|nr:ATP-binding protein [Leptospira perolatii]PJZ71119.1 hypothetical protein CH360_00950 [Leptospira perolatii]PJZ74651.1 hypothetical protein CH373_00950 [Leptospira perolatii]
MSKDIQIIFSQIWEMLKEYEDLVTKSPAIIAYSGGKDSTLIVHFYLWMKEQDLLQKDPILYHLDHSIRSNQIQEDQIRNHMESFELPSIFKKKTYHSFPKSQGIA